MNITPASAAAFAVICVALWLGWLWHEYTHAPLLDDPAESEPLLDRIAREHLAGFFAEWQQQVESEGRRS